MTTFAELNLNPDIAKALDACGYKNPTPIQQKSIPSILTGKDLVASAQTGTGKTAAFVLPALHRLSLAQPKNKPRILILTPTRELATQINVAAAKYGKFLRFRIASLVGGMPYRQQLRELSRSVDIIVATPGRLLDHMENHRLDLSAIEMLILDEADRMLDMGFIDDVREIANVTSKNRQTLLFSATVDDKLSHVIRQLLKDPVRIDLSQEKLTPTQITQKVYIADNQQHKTKLLQHFLQNESIYKAIIFSATKMNADSLSRQLRDQGFAAAALHGDLKQGTRNKTIDNLRRGKIQYLIATDVAARGIDINDITHVINYDLPKFSEDYVHRIGRTGRAGRTGVAISFASPVDARHLQRLERYMGQKLEFATIVGLEPTKSIKSEGTNPAKKKRYGKSNSGKGDFEPRRREARFSRHSQEDAMPKANRERNRDALRIETYEKAVRGNREEGRGRGRSEGERGARFGRRSNANENGSKDFRDYENVRGRRDDNNEGRRFRSRDESRGGYRDESSERGARTSNRGGFRTESNERGARTSGRGGYGSENAMARRGRSVRSEYRAEAHDRVRPTRGGYRATESSDRSERPSRGRSFQGASARREGKPRRSRG